MIFEESLDLKLHPLVESHHHHTRGLFIEAMDHKRLPKEIANIAYEVSLITTSWCTYTEPATGLPNHGQIVIPKKNRQITAGH